MSENSVVQTQAESVILEIKKKKRYVLHACHSAFQNDQARTNNAGKAMAHNGPTAPTANNGPKAHWMHIMGQTYERRLRFGRV